MKAKNQDEDFDDFNDPFIEVPQKEVSLEDMNRLVTASGGVVVIPDNAFKTEISDKAVKLPTECSMPVVVNIDNEFLKKEIEKIAEETKKEILLSNIPEVKDDIVKRWLELKVDSEVEVTFKGTIVAIYKKNNPYPTLLLRTRCGLKHLYPDDEAVTIRLSPKKS